MRLHELGTEVATLAERNGLLGRLEAERLANACGATVEELVEAGLWGETDLSYVIYAVAI